MASAMPASPQHISSLTRHISRPVGSEKHLAMKSNEYRPILAASSMIGHGVSSRSSHSGPAGRTTFSANSCTHFDDLELVLVEFEGVVGHGASSFWHDAGSGRSLRFVEPQLDNVRHFRAAKPRVPLLLNSNLPSGHKSTTFGKER